MAGNAGSGRAGITLRRYAWAAIIVAALGLPSPFHSWMPGHWRYLGGTWVWARGRWAEAPEGGRSWQAGHWERRSYGYVWVPGYWTSYFDDVNSPFDGPADGGPESSVKLLPR
jgi:hypothetical protein